MKSSKNYIYILFLTLVSCLPFQEEIEAPLPYSGNVNLNKFVAVGDGYIAGFMDGALYDQGQKKFDSCNNGESNGNYYRSKNFISLISILMWASLGMEKNGEILGKLNLTSSNDEYSVEAVNPGEEIGFYFGDKDSLNNFGVPQAKVIDALAPSFIGKSTHFSRFASDPASATIY